MGDKLNSVILRNRMIYKTEFDTVPESTDKEDDYYEEIVYYDGGGVDGYGDSETN